MTLLLLTRNRRRWLPYALRCARYQTYRPTEILVVADGENVADLIPPTVRYLHLPGTRTIGAKRNSGVESARGELIAHWDDDDFSAPGRLADQVQRLKESGKAVTGYRSMRFTDGERWWLYSGASDYALGTSLCYRRTWWERYRFPESQVGEDNEFIAPARAQRQIVTADAGEFMWATIHRENTSPRVMKGKQWTEL